jgi:Flp pilus assembly protein TadB
MKGGGPLEFFAVLFATFAVVAATVPFLRTKLKSSRARRRAHAAVRGTWGRQKSWYEHLAQHLGADRVDRLCQYAGRPYGLTGVSLLQYQFLFALIWMAIFGATSLFLAVAGGLVAWFMPRVLLSSMAQQRRVQIALELPSFLDLWGLLVAAGEGVESALVEICRRHPDWMLSSEVRRALERISASGLFGESLVEEAKVTGSPDFVAVAEQISHLADGGGVPSRELGRMAEQLREQRMADLAQSAGAMAVVGIFPKLGAVFLSLIPVMATIVLTVTKSL